MNVCCKLMVGNPFILFKALMIPSIELCSCFLCSGIIIECCFKGILYPVVNNPCEIVRLLVLMEQVLNAVVDLHL